MTQRPTNAHERYHAHVYFDEDSFDFAQRLCMEAWQRFHIQLGRMRRRPIGPHPRWSCQLTFESTEFDKLIPWLDENRGDLSSLVHPLMGDVLAEHTTHAAWLGDEMELDVGVFSKTDLSPGR